MSGGHTRVTLTTKIFEWARNCVGNFPPRIYSPSSFLIVLLSLQHSSHYQLFPEMSFLNNCQEAVRILNMLITDNTGNILIVKKSRKKMKWNKNNLIFISLQLHFNILYYMLYLFLETWYFSSYPSFHYNSLNVYLYLNVNSKYVKHSKWAISHARLHGIYEKIIFWFTVG